MCGGYLTKSNQYVRKPLQVKEFRSAEKKYRIIIGDILKKQSNKVLTKKFIQEAVNKYNQIKDVNKSDEEDTQFEDYLDEELNNHPVLQNDSNNSNELLNALIALILLIMLIGLKLDKLKTIRQLEAIGDKRLQPVIDSINIDNLEITNKAILDFIDSYAATLVGSINATSKIRLKNFIITNVKAGKSVEEIVSAVSKVEKISVRRSYTIVRTEIANARSFETRKYLESRGYEFWIWICNMPEDVGCLSNCGSIRHIGESFPSGHAAPTVHPNCQCFVEGWVPSTGYALELFILLILAGIDWDGE